MFGRRKSSESPTVEAALGLLTVAEAPIPAVPVAPPEPEPTRPEPISVVTVDEDGLAEYAALAKKIGFSNPAIMRARALNFLQREEIPVYDNKRVADFMDGLVLKMNGGKRYNPMSTESRKVWLWRPLREKDADIADANNWVWDGYFVSRPYDQAVPLDVLRTVDRIASAFAEARFFVTDYETVRPDPFLCFKCGRDMEHIIVAAWDEPDFKLTKK